MPSPVAPGAVSCAFIDIAYLRAEGARALGVRTDHLRPHAPAIVEWLRRLGDAEHSPYPGGAQHLRTYWYDGAFDPEHPLYRSQRKFFDGIAFTPGVQLRLGHLVERQSTLRGPMQHALRETANELGIEPDRLVDAFGRHWQFRPELIQKGVDTLLALDLVRLAQHDVYDVGILVAGDRDLAEAVRAAQDMGRRIVIASPSPDQTVARELLQLADHVITFQTAELAVLLPARSPREPAPQPAPLPDPAAAPVQRLGDAAAATSDDHV